MDENLKKKLSMFAIIISIIVLIVSFIGNYKTSKQIEEDFLAVDRSPLQAFRLIDYKETGDGVFIDVVSVTTGKKYENNFLSKTCPNGKDKKPGMIMQLSIVENLRTQTNETFYTLDRAYEYLCTTLDMKAEDEKLFKRIDEARERTQLESGIVKKANKAAQ